MNIHFEQVERRSQVVSYLLAAFAVFTILMLTLSFVREAELHWSFSATSGQAVQVENNDLPVPIPAPLPPTGQEPSGVRHEPAAESPSILVPQVIAVPMPSVP
jgi:hypothetical protein